MNPNVVSNRTLHQRNDGAANNRHVNEAGASTRQWPKFSHTQAKDAWEHDGVEESDSDHAPHRQVTARYQRKRDERRGANRTYGEQTPSLNLLQHRGSDEASHHRASPVERDITGGDLRREARDLGLTEVVHHKAAN